MIMLKTRALVENTPIVLIQTSIEMFLLAFEEETTLQHD